MLFRSPSGNGQTRISGGSTTRRVGVTSPAVTERSPKALVVDDSPEILHLVASALRRDGFEVAEAADGTTAVESARADGPDLVVLDMQIGTMGGIAVTMDLRLDESSNSLPHVPILVLLDRTVDIHMARRSGADGWLIKPLDSLRLRRAARAVAGEIGRAHV